MLLRTPHQALRISALVIEEVDPLASHPEVLEI